MVLIRYNNMISEIKNASETKSSWDKKYFDNKVNNIRFVG